MISILPGLLVLLLSMPLCSCATYSGDFGDRRADLREALKNILKSPWHTTSSTQPLLRTGSVYTPSDSSTIDLGGERANLKIPF